MLDVVALGAIVESEDLTAPPRRPKLNVFGHVHPPTSDELDAARSERHERSGGFFAPLPPEMMLASRRKTLESGRLRLYAEEFADLSDGRRVILRDDRGWGLRPIDFRDSSWKFASGRELAKQAILVLDPDDNERWIEWVVERLRFLGIDVDPVSVHAAPFKVEFGPRVRHELRQRKPGG